MKIGKLPNDVLSRLVLDPISKYGLKRDEMITSPSVGEDCAALRFGEDICLLSSDPITGAAEDIGMLAVNVNANDIASAGGEVIGLMVTTLLPPDITEAEISKMAESLYKSAHDAGIAILGGHTEVTDAVTRPVISCTVIGRTKRFVSSGGAQAGDSVIMTKYAGIEGSCILASDNREKLLGRLTDGEIGECESFKNSLSVAAEGRIASEMGASAMHDVTEGGILGACHEVAECSGKGITVYADKIPVLPVTKKLCNIFGINPLRLISSGSMLITASQPDKLIAALKDEGIAATVIGVITGDKKLIVRDGVTEPLAPPDVDELYRAKIK